MDINIRPYKPTDKDSLVHIFKNNVPKYFDPSEINDFKNYLHTKSDTYLTVESENRIVGGVGYEANTLNQTGSITWIFFDPECTGKGIGSKAVDHCIHEIKKNSHINRLTVRTSQLAYQFFEKFGFTLMKTEKNYWGEGLDLYEMEMTDDG